MLPRETEVGLMTLQNFNMVVSGLQVKRKHEGFCRDVGQGSFPVFIFDAHLSQTLINVS